MSKEKISPIVFKGTGDIMLAVYIPPISSKLEPAGSLYVILPHTLTVIVAHTHMVLGQCIAFFRSLAVPFHRFDHIRLHTSAQLAGIGAARAGATGKERRRL